MATDEKTILMELLRSHHTEATIDSLFTVLMPPSNLPGIGPASQRLVEAITFIPETWAVQQDWEALSKASASVAALYGSRYEDLARTGQGLGYPDGVKMSNRPTYAAWLAPALAPWDRFRPLVLGALAALQINPSSQSEAQLLARKFCASTTAPNQTIVNGLPDLKGRDLPICEFSFMLLEKPRTLRELGRALQDAAEFFERAESSSTNSGSRTAQTSSPSESVCPVLVESDLDSDSLPNLDPIKESTQPFAKNEPHNFERLRRQKIAQNAKSVKKAQLLSMSPDCLSLAEITFLLTCAQELAISRGATTDYSKSVTEATCRILTGRSLENSLIVANGTDPVTADSWPKSCYSAFFLEQQIVRHRICKKNKDQETRHSFTLDLPIPIFLVQLLRRLGDHGGMTKVGVTSLTKRMNARFGRRITHARLFKTLCHRLRTLSRDPIVLAWLANDTKLLRTHNGDHYFRTPVAPLRDLYVECIENLYRRIGLDASPFSSSVCFDTTENRMCGVADEPVWTQFIDSLKDRVRHAKQHSVDRHNALAHYTAELCLMATGHRLVDGVFDSISHFTSGLDTLVTSDKKPTPYHHWRRLPVAGMAQNQLGEFNVSARSLTTSDCIQRPLRRQLEKSLDSNGTDFAPFLSIIEGNSLLALSRQQLLDARMQAGIGPSSHRVVLRSQLCARGCHPRAVDWLLGHFQQGTSIDDRFQTVSVNAFHQHVTTHTQRILLEQGWEVLS